jgi:3-dehydroquinate synthase
LKQFQIEENSVEISRLEESSLHDLLTVRYAESRKIIMVDENTHDNCLEYLLTTFTELEKAEVMLLPAGEENKVLEVCFQVWEAMSEYGIVRSDLIINLGGGVVTDMGGFIASVFKRGVDFIHIPTSLLGMVDAAIGGKTGIDLGPYKNQIGTFEHPKAVYIDPAFLQTLPEEQLVSGYAEMLKHGLIADKRLWELFHTLDPIKLIENEHLIDVIARSVDLKVGIVNEDPKEKYLRKALNFGHTIGHGIEGFCLQNEPITHGHAVALGMMAESYLSLKRSLITEREYMEITTYLSQIYDYVVLTEEAKQEVIHLIRNDKKNDNQGIRCVLLNGIGAVKIDEIITDKELHDALTSIDNVFSGN